MSGGGVVEQSTGCVPCLAGSGVENALTQDTSNSVRSMCSCRMFEDGNSVKTATACAVVLPANAPRCTLLRPLYAFTPPRYYHISHNKIARIQFPHSEAETLHSLPTGRDPLASTEPHNARSCRISSCRYGFTQQGAILVRGA